MEGGGDVLGGVVDVQLEFVKFRDNAAEDHGQDGGRQAFVADVGGEEQVAQLDWVGEVVVTDAAVAG